MFKEGVNSFNTIKIGNVIGKINDFMNFDIEIMAISIVLTMENLNGILKKLWI
jgi:hypothetical protein